MKVLGKSFFILLFILFFSCKEKTEKETLFKLRKPQTKSLDFSNDLTHTEDFNPYVYRNFYNGGGVALGDINNDGLLDVYFTGNQVNNKLFLNKGNWKFEDITQTAGVGCPSVWSTGATFVDINNDGLLDLYVCKSGMPGGTNRNNELFINNGPSASSGQVTFTEKSKEYGLDITGLSVQAAFFDYDKDGDLDCYLLNNSIRSVGGFDLIKDQRDIPSPDGNKFLENDNGHFKDVSSSRNIYSSAIGFGLGITISDFNNDNWPDLFISNDFFEKDYLYINEKGFRFNEKSDTTFSSLSMGSMGADAADLNNDLLSEIMVTEMLPTTLQRKKTKAIYESWDKYTLASKKGYAHQFPRNVLQQNMGENGFFEVSRIAGLDATEWSWSTLFFDMDNDGLKDIFVSNGIYKDLLDRDYINYMSNPETVRNLMQNTSEAVKEMIDMMPSGPLPNAAFLNKGDFEFKSLSDSLGLGQPSFSNGSAYGDLDNDGDLDLVVNNVNMPSFVYENNSDKSTNNFLKIRFRGNGKNTKAIGAKVYIYYDEGKNAYFENFTSRGFQSSIAPEIVIGIGQSENIDSLKVIWPNDQVSVYKTPAVNTTLIVDQKNAIAGQSIPITTNTSLFNKLPALFNFEHLENNTVDFKKEQLLDRMVSNEGPAFTLADLNNDGKPDFYLGGAKNQSGELFVSSYEGYEKTSIPFLKDKASEDTDAQFFDSDNDGDLDLYVCSGSKAFSRFDSKLHDRLYLNNGAGEFSKSPTPLPFNNTISSSTVSTADYDNDGDLDIFIGERFNPESYGNPSSGYLLKNLGNNRFELDPQTPLNNIGLITSSHWCDLNDDSYPDLIVAGEWMPISIFINQKGTLQNKTEEFGLQNTTGIWSSLHIADIDQDGDLDILAGNIGNNYVYKKGTALFFYDFDQNGKPEQILCQKMGDKYYPIIDKDELISQLPELKKKFLYYKDYAEADLARIFDEPTLKNSLKYELETTETSLFLNEKDSFKLVRLPSEIQYSNVYAIETVDINKDGKLDILFGGNQDLIKPQFGKLDASKGWALFGSADVNDFSGTIPKAIGIEGQIRGLKTIDHTNRRILVSIMNNSEVDFYEF